MCGSTRMPNAVSDIRDVKLQKIELAQIAIEAVHRGTSGTVYIQRPLLDLH